MAEPRGSWGDVWLTIGTANIGRKRGAAASREAIEKVADFAPGAQWGLTEIGEADRWDEHKMIRQAFGDRHLVGMSTREPIAIPSWWNLERAMVLRGAPGIPRISPTRTWTAALTSRNGIRVGHLNGHPVAGAFNRRKDRADALRRAYWWLMWRRGRKYVKGWVDNGITTVVTGDMNRLGRVPKIHPDAIEIEHGLDVIQIIPAKGTRVQVGERGHFPLPVESAHDAVWASIRLTLVKE